MNDINKGMELVGGPFDGRVLVENMRPTKPLSEVCAPEYTECTYLSTGLRTPRGHGEFKFICIREVTE